MAMNPKHLPDPLPEPAGDLLNAIPSYGPDGKPLDPTTSKERWTPLAKRPKPEEIDYSQTSDDMIISGNAVLKDKRKITW